MIKNYSVLILRHLEFFNEKRDSGEINEMAPVRLSCPMLSWPLTPCSVNNDFAQLCNSWNHLYHCTCTSQSTCLNMGYFSYIGSTWKSPGGCVCVHTGATTMKALAAAALGLHWNNTLVMLYEVMLWLCCYYIMVILWLLLQPLHKPRERLYYGSCASQERRKVSAVPMAPCVFFQPLSSSLAYPGFSKQCGEYE